MRHHSFIEKELRRFRSLPRMLWFVLAAGIAFLIANFITLLSMSGIKIDPGSATLFGAIIGLCVVAWQTSRGFANLIRSQENQARIERQGRLHAAEIEKASREDDRTHERQILLSGIRAEIVALLGSASSSATSCHQMAILYRGLHETGVPNTLKEFSFIGFDAPFYSKNIDKIGILGVSLAADVVKVFSRAKESQKVV